MGATVVEFAVVANTLLLTTFAGMEFARLHMLRNTVQNASFYGAREGIVSGASAERVKAAASEMLNAIGAKGFAVIVNEGQAISPENEYVTVRVTLDYLANSHFASRFMPQKTYEATTRLATEQSVYAYQRD